MYIPIGFGSLLLLSTLFYAYRHRGVDRGDVDKVISAQSISFSNDAGNIYDSLDVDGDIEREINRFDLENDYEEPVVMNNLNNYDIAVDGEETENVYYVATS